MQCHILKCLNFIILFFITADLKNVKYFVNFMAFNSKMALNQELGGCLTTSLT